MKSKTFRLSITPLTFNPNENRLPENETTGSFLLLFFSRNIEYTITTDPFTFLLQSFQFLTASIPHSVIELTKRKKKMKSHKLYVTLSNRKAGNLLTSIKGFLLFYLALVFYVFLQIHADLLQSRNEDSGILIRNILPCFLQSGD